MVFFEGAVPQTKCSKNLFQFLLIFDHLSVNGDGRQKTEFFPMFRGFPFSETNISKFE